MTIEMWPIDRPKDYPKNARKWTDKAIAKVAASIREFGFRQPLVVDSQEIIVIGHLRRTAARTLGLTEIPVHVASDLSPAQIKALRLADNRTSQEATWDLELLRPELLELKALDFDLSVTAFDVREIERKTKPADEEPEPESEEFQGIFAFRECAILPSSNEWGIPDLRADMLATQIPRELWPGGDVGNPAAKLFLHGTAKFLHDCIGGTLAFYVEDHRFECIWSDAVKFAGSLFGKWGAVCSPDFSVWRDDPLSVQLFNFYRSRWCARYWQEAGIKIIPSLNWSDERSDKFALAGLPANPPVVSVQCRTTKSRKGKEFFIRGIVRGISELKPGAVVIYGLAGREWVEPELPSGPEYVWIEDWATARKRIRNEKAKAGVP